MRKWEEEKRSCNQICRYNSLGSFKRPYHISVHFKYLEGFK